MQLSIIGSGHVGLVSGLCFAEKGHTVLCVDHDAAKIKKLKAGKVTFHEPHMQELLTKHIAAKTISFSTDTKDAVDFGAAIFVCVSTPSMPDGNVDMRYFEAVSRDIAEHISEYRVIVEKSTVPIKTSSHMRANIERYLTREVDFDVASNPEFLREGQAIDDTLNPDRIVCGVTSHKAARVMQEVYAPFTAPLLMTTIQSAELIKLASNAFLATRLSFINAISRICELGGANIQEVAEGMGLDKRIGKHFLSAGIGYGGSCFPKDVSGMYHVSKALGYDFELLGEVQRVNEDQWQHFLARLEDTLWVLNGKTIALWGLAFKPDTDDIREAPALKIANALIAKGAKVVGYDPAANENAKGEVPDIHTVESALEACKDADALMICTEWSEFADVDLAEVKSALRVPVIFDGRNQLDPDTVKAAGFHYVSVGR